MFTHTAGLVLEHSCDLDPEIGVVQMWRLAYEDPISNCFIKSVRLVFAKVKQLIRI